MDAAATPELIVRYLRELSADLVAAAVLTRDGRTLAGPAALGAAAGRVAQATGDAPLVELRDARHLVVLGRGDEHVLVAVHTGHALPGLVRHDVLTALRDLGDDVPDSAPDGSPLLAATVARSVAADLLSVAQALAAATPQRSATRQQHPKRSLFAKIRRV